MLYNTSYEGEKMYYNWKEKIEEKELNKIGNLIRNGELVVFPTETVYGIGANALDTDAVQKIFKAKGRPSDNPLIVHLAKKEQITEIATDISDIEWKLINSFMPGPFTIILKRKEIVPNIVTAGLETVAIRIPNNEIAQKIIENANVPIAAPSANISGKPSGTTFETVKSEFENRVAAIIDGGETEIGLESTVVKVIDNVPVILRPGRVTPEDIKDAIGIVKIDDKILKKVQENQKVESPGMKYKHYSPDTKCKLIYFENEKMQIDNINKIIKEYDENIIILAFSESIDKLEISKDKIIDVGSKNHLEEMAKKIYEALRKADKLKPKIILIEGTKNDGLGIAIMNRLLRTCEYDFLTDK